MLHKNHRQRMRDRFINEGPDHFAIHELLEILLYYSKPQVDTNPCAHELMERFGGIKGIFEASVEELMDVDGVGEQSAVLLHLIPELLRRYEREVRVPVIAYDTLSKMAHYLHSYFVGRSTERLYMMVFNNRMNLIDFVKVSEGTVNGTDIFLREMEERILRKKGASILIAHNHPNGLPVPSGNDLEVTETLYRHLDSLGIIVLEHLIFTDDRFFPIMKTHFGTCRQSPVQGMLSTTFYGNFYDFDTDVYVFPKILDKNEDQEADGAVEESK